MKKTLAVLVTIFSMSFLYAQKTVKYKGYEYSLMIHRLKIEQRVLVKEKFPVDVKITCLSHILEKDVPLIDEKLGFQYSTAIREDVVRSVARAVFGKYELLELLVFKRELFETEIEIDVAKKFKEYHIQLDNVLIESILPSKNIQKALEANYLALQEKEKQAHLKEIEKRKLEIAKMKTEAEAERNAIIDKSLTEKVLQQKYIETLQKLAESENAKIIIFSDKKMDIPKILDED